MFFKQLLQSSTVRLALIALVLCGVTLVGSRSTGEAKAADHGNQQSMVSLDHFAQSGPNAIQEAKYFECTGVSIGIDRQTDNLTVFCANRPAEGDIFAFVIHGIESKTAARVMAMVLSSMASSTKVGITFNTTISTVPNCDPVHCRDLLALGYSG